MKSIRSVIAALNNTFISIILVFVYFVVIGFSALTFYLVMLLAPKRKSDSYWEEVKEKDLDIKSYESPY